MPFFSESCERNKQPVWDVAGPYFEKAGDILEIGSGTGQHAAFFSQQMPAVKWVMTDCEPYLSQLDYYFDKEGHPNVVGPLALDVRDEVWPISETGLLYTANSLHIMGWDCVEHFFAGAGRVLKAGGYLVVYGPFKYGGEFTTPSNADFDLWLKDRDPVSGVRDFEEVDRLAKSIGLELVADHAMPANNQCLIWNRVESL